jgi:hypothetical protein
MMTIKKIPLLLLVLALAGCASAPGGSPSAQAGTSSVINGVEVWQNGTPSRPYQVIATIQKEGADNSATYLDEEKFIAHDASQQGADAVIVLDTVMVVSRMSLMDGRAIMAPKVDAELIKYQ